MTGAAVGGSIEADGGDREKSPFRWLDTVRYLVAAVMTVLILAVIVNAIKVVLRPESLAFSVRRGSVFARKIPQPAPMLLFELNLKASNPSGRVRVYYQNFTAYLFDKNTPAAASNNPRHDCFLYFFPKDNAVEQQERVEAFVQVQGTRDGSMAASVFDPMYNNRTIMYDVTMRLEGFLITEIRSGFNTTPRWSTYYCAPLIIGGDSDDEAFQNIRDAPCIPR